jgi:hypothetical protein
LRQQTPVRSDTREIDFKDRARTLGRIASHLCP